MPKTKCAILQMKTRSNKKVEGKKPALKFDFTKESIKKN